MKKWGVTYVIRALAITLFFVLTVANTSLNAQVFKWSTSIAFPGLDRDDAIAFTINDIVYVGTGNHSGFAESNRFYGFDIAANSWNEVAPFPGVARQYAKAEVIGTKGYVFAGIDLFSNPLNDLWEYDSETNSWQELAVFPGGIRWQTASFVINDILYCGTGRDFDTLYNDFWKYEPNSNAWTRLNDLPKTACYETVSFAIENSGYLGLGADFDKLLADFWEYDALKDEWTRLADYPGGPRSYAKAETYNGLGFVGTGMDTVSLMQHDVWAYDKKFNRWLPMPDLPSTKRRGVASATSRFNGIYFICGLDENFDRRNDVYNLNFEASQQTDYSFFYSPLQGTIFISDLVEVTSIQVHNLQGQLVHEFEVNSSYIQIPANWATGMYILSGSGISEKIIVR